MSKIPILDFDPSKDAIISPRKIARTTAKCAVLSFFWEAVGEYANANRCEHLSSFTSEMPDIPLYLHKENNFLLVPMPVGAPLAAAVLEQLIAIGVERFVVGGGAGVLEPIQLGNLVPLSEMKELHITICLQKSLQNQMRFWLMKHAPMKEHDIPHEQVTTWTTDAFYRETPEIVALRRSQGAMLKCKHLSVCSCHRDVKIVQILYSGDDVSGESWNKPLGTSNRIPEEIFFT